MKAPDVLYRETKSALSMASFRVDEGHYDPAAFGNWFLVAGIGADAYRLVYDGRDGWLILQKRVGNEWCDARRIRDVHDHTGESIVEVLTELAADPVA